VQGHVTTLEVVRNNNSGIKQCCGPTTLSSSCVDVCLNGDDLNTSQGELHEVETVPNNDTVELNWNSHGESRHRAIV
jgi:hypothetical protein